MLESLQQWFIREIIPHEAALMRFMSRVWRDRDEIADLRQETYARVYEAAARLRPTYPRSFLFATARHLMTDRVRRNKIVSIEVKGDLDLLNVWMDEISLEQSIGAHQELRRLGLAFESLPTECREVLWMRKVEELPQKEVASRLGIKEKTVEKRVARGVRLLTAALSYSTGARNGKSAPIESECEHG